MLAKIIVDVPTIQTDKPFTYLVPAELENTIKPGMRVSVPFGKANRKISGITVDIKSNDKTIDESKLKYVDQLLDDEPILPTELLKMSTWLAKETLSFRISAFQAMIPTQLKTKTYKLFKLIDNDGLNEDELKFVDNYLSQSENLINLKKLTKKENKILNRLQNKHKLRVTYRLEDQKQIKLVDYLKANLNKQELDEQIQKTKKNAIKQLAVLNGLLALQQGSILLSEFCKQYKVTRTDINHAQDKGWLRIFKQEAYRNPFFERQVARDVKPTLNDDQQIAVEKIQKAIINNQNDVFLLEGVTGSGKTEVYLRSIENALNAQQTALILVPEISLTPQIVKRLRARFGDLVAVLHSSLNSGERYDEWRRIQRGEAKVVVGTRSASFAPLDNIGVLIVDEEHEPSYKQQDMLPYYHARDVMIWRSKWHHAPVILGSATPSMESRARAEKGVYVKLSLPKRINDKNLPLVQLVDMSKELRQQSNIDFSKTLLNKINEKINKHEQVIIFLNRRGFSSYLMCRECGYTFKCPNCDVSLVYHAKQNKLRCHYCDYEVYNPGYCPKCNAKDLSYGSSGTEKVAKDLKDLFPMARVERLDADITKRKFAYEKILKRFEQQQIDILVGTQMLAKGLDYPNVTLVGVLNADTGLNLPDFHASERTFQLLTQVSGRSGRSDKTGEVVVQTYNPKHYAIQLAKEQDYERFFKVEMHFRHLGKYIPYYYSALIVAHGINENYVVRKINDIAHELKQKLSEEIILGPSPQMITRVNNQYYYQLIIKYKKLDEIYDILHELLLKYQLDNRNKFNLRINLNPQSMA